MGHIEFKYKKDTVLIYFNNGEFKFAIDNTVLLLDNNPNNNDWQIFKTDNI